AGKADRCSSPYSRASRVFPTPGAPTSVTSRRPPSNASASRDRSRTRPNTGVAGAWKLVKGTSFTATAPIFNTAVRLSMPYLSRLSSARAPLSVVEEPVNAGLDLHVVVIDVRSVVVRRQDIRENPEVRRLTHERAQLACFGLLGAMRTRAARAV